MSRTPWSRYRELLSWLGTDSLVRFRGRVFLIIGASLLATAAEVNALALVIRYGRLLADDGTMEVAGEVLSARSSFALLAMFVATVMAALIAAAILNWIHRIRLLRLRRDYEIFCSHRALRVAADAEFFPPLMGRTDVTDGIILRIARMDARYCGRMMVALLSSLPPIVVAISAAALMLWIDPLLTVILAVPLAIAVLVLTRIGIRGAAASRQIESLQPVTARAFSGVLRSARSTSGSSADSSWIRRRLFDASPTRDFFDAYERRLRAGEHSDLVAGFLLAAGVSIIVLVIGRASILDGGGWDRMVIYFLALRYALVNVKSVFAKLTNINRFYPQLRRYLDFISLPTTRTPSDGPPPPLRSAANAVRGSIEETEPAPGDMIAALLPCEPTSFNLLRIARGLAGEDGARAFAANTWIVGVHTTEQLPEPDDLGVPAVADLDPELRAALDVVMHEGSSIDRRRIGLASIAAAATQRRFLLIDERVLRHAGGAECLPAAASARLVVLIGYAVRPETAFAHGESLLVAAGADGAIGIGDASWWADHREEVLKQRNAGAPVARVPDIEDEDDEDG